MCYGLVSVRKNAPTQAMGVVTLMLKHVLWVGDRLTAPSFLMISIICLT